MAGQRKIIQNKKKKSTTALYTNCRNDAWMRIVRRTQQLRDTNAYKLSVMPDTIVATVHLQDDDEWSDETGSVEAFRKADAKHKREFTKAIKRFILYYCKMLKAIDEDIFKECYVEVMKGRKG